MGFSTSCCLAAVFISSALLLLIDAKSDDIGDLRLELVQVVFRHGNRTPEYPYYNDPNANEDFYPYGWNSLDKAGRQRSYELGKYLKRRYGDFVGEYNPNEVTVWSTTSVRTNMCAQLAAAGLFPPKQLMWDAPGYLGHIWTPVAIDSVENPLTDALSIESDPVLCPAYFNEDRMISGPAMQELVNSDPELYEVFLNNGVNNDSDDMFKKKEVLRTYVTMSIEENYNMTFPDWVKPFYPDRMKACADYIMAIKLTTDKMIRLTTGSFLEHMIKQMNLKEKGSRKKIWLYSGHDVSVFNLGVILGVWRVQYIDFSAAILMELYSNQEGRYFVKTFFHNDTSKEPVSLTVAGCREICPLNQFRRLFNRWIPENLLEECSQV